MSVQNFVIMGPRAVVRGLRCGLMGLGLSVLFAASAHAQQTSPAGQVEATRGVGFVQSPGASPRIMGQGAAVNEGDTLTTGKDSFAVVRMSDGTRMTVRPESQLVMNTYKYDDRAKSGSMVMGLLRGGLRTITGLIAKSSPEAAKIRTATATIGIRGTDFDARICAKNCVAEGRSAASTGVSERPAVVPASARVVKAVGEVQAVSSQGERRRVVDGGALYGGDTVETATGGSAILAFRDESRLGMGAATRMKIDSFVFDKNQPSEGRMFLNFLRGSIRVVTGLVAKSQPNNVMVRTATATMGVRGTEFIITCLGSCAGEDGQAPVVFVTYTIAGQTISTLVSNGSVVPIPAGAGIQMTPDGQIVALTQQPNIDVPNPDVPMDFERLFGLQNPEDVDSGLFVFVRDGHIELASGSQILHLGRGETGQVQAGGNSVRPLLVPLFIDLDRIPLPNGNAQLLGLLQQSGVNPRRVCKQ